MKKRRMRKRERESIGRRGLAGGRVDKRKRGRKRRR